MKAVLRRVAVVASIALVLAGCGGEGNTDPRKGRVTLDESGCFWGDCYDLYEFCLGPDLHIVYDEAGDDDYQRTEENSPECALAIDGAAS